ncbi:hypothetical protein LshimejAT787_1700970 [Lyophyllum shimeji]|uniref:Uncharacterized protein n=1 Tax=Lyophyllum shimeji TaxID=47721 RepID=A0A9P3UU86_LYOSH|nr:hypothetical protein LshimejAT787_1700970 [Lyophyllum shimeji]
MKLGGERHHCLMKHCALTARPSRLWSSPSPASNCDPEKYTFRDSKTPRVSMALHAQAVFWSASSTTPIASSKERVPRVGVERRCGT